MNESYHDGVGYCEERISNPRHCCVGSACCAAATEAPSGSALLQKAAAMFGGDGGLCDIALLGARNLTFGHEVRMMPAGYVKPYVKRSKNDAADAEAICEAVTRPSMPPEAVSALFLLAIIPPNVNSIRQVLSGIPANGELDMKGFVSLRFGNTPQLNAPANDDKSLTPRRRWQQHVMQVIPRHLRAR